MTFVCGINTREHVGGRPPRSRCKERFDSFEELLDHVRTEHHCTLFEGRTDGDTASSQPN